MVMTSQDTHVACGRGLATVASAASASSAAASAAAPSAAASATASVAASATSAAGATTSAAAVRSYRFLATRLSVISHVISYLPLVLRQIPSFFLQFKST